MRARFSPPLFRFAFWAICWTFLMSVTLVANEYHGPVFPGGHTANTRLTEPLPLPKSNPLLQRPSNKQVVFDDLDPVGPLISQGVLYEEEFDFQPTHPQPMPGFRQNRMPARATPINNGNVIFMDDDEYIQSGMWRTFEGFEGEIVGEYPMNSYFSGPIPITFGMGFFDNLALFAETTTFKTELNNGMASYGSGQGINWSAAATPQGTVTVQYGVRAVQGDMFSRPVRHQTFMTAGVFKRFPMSSFQGGVAVDWLHDHSCFGSVDVRQMRCELSMRSPRDLEYGFIGAFDVFRDRPAIRNHRDLLYHGYPRYAAVDVQDYYLLFVRKHLPSCGLVELRCGATERGDFIMGTLGEAAISDRLVINGGFTMLAPSEGRSAKGNYRENWSVSLGIVLYFRGGAMIRSANVHRPMFNVAGNDSFFTRITGW
ncbi:MAG: hypothetical protein FWE95_03765 [Planctomycetaceae bacterium]|nr:hypothetical protein [Planctomycetaceae bacterium]